MAQAQPAASRRVRVRIDGTVQGVGYRPFVYRLAAELELSGWVLNDERGVLVEAEGPADAVASLVSRLRSAAPPLADVRDVTSEDVPATGAQGFEIVTSTRSGAATAPITPDTASCAECLAELADPADRRYRYPFLNCTNCGPRFTIVRGIPYDRPTTTMAGFEMCAACRAEYEDPLDRRFHAQPNACPACGPQARLLEPDGTSVALADGVDAVRAAADDLLAGRVLAIKGLGGYHLACRADDERAVSALRARKHREDRPFALLVADVAAARKLVTLDDEEAALLSSRQRPIVLAARRPDAESSAAVAASVAPRAPELGLMLAYTPLHELLAADAGVPLVLTSGNVSDEPIAFEDDDALQRLAPIADRFLVHDRPIATRTDDSVARVVRGRPLLLRRSRGFVPASIDLPVASPLPLLGCGAEQKAAFCLARGTRAWVSHHIGDIKNYETLQSLQDGVAHFERLFEVTPQAIAHDLHPDYLSTRYALERVLVEGGHAVKHIGVQHHHAHLAATLAEHGERGPAVGAIFDGTGYGTDGAVWGGELLVGGVDGYERAGHLRAVRMPGGERAIRQPWRMALAWLVELHGEDVAPPPALAGIDARTWQAVAHMVATGTSAPLTTSMGRLFDAVAALCGVRSQVSYEGQAAIELEALADLTADGAYELELVAGGERGAGSSLGSEAAGVAPAILDPAAAIEEILEDLAAGVGAGTVSARFHAGVANATADACVALAARAGVDTAVLSGGVFQNRLLLERTAIALERRGLRVLVPERLPPNDGQIAFGQVAVAAAQLAG